MNKLVAFAGITGFLILWSTLERFKQQPGAFVYITPDGVIERPFVGPSDEGVLPLNEVPRADTMRLDEVPRSRTVTVPRSADLPRRQR